MVCDPMILAVPGVRGLVPYQPGKPIEELERELGVTGAIKLASNENPYGPGPKARDAAAAALAQMERYPDGGCFALKRALAQRLGVSGRQITLGNGSNDVLELIARTFLSPGEVALCDQYAFAAYPISVRGIGAHMIQVPSRGYAHDLDAMAHAVSPSVRMVFLANPNNPTGTWFGKDALAAFLAAVPASTIVVLDEAYCEYVTEADYPDGCRYLAAHPNLVVVRTFSKIHGLAGLRVGYAVSDPALAELMNRLRQPFNVNSVAQAAAVAALGDEGYVERMRDANAAERAALATALKGRGFMTLPSAGNFLCVEVGDAARLYDALLRAGVIVRPLAPYGMATHLRITVGRPEENARLMRALADIARAA
ncbi:histidinol-phosphate transaminase [Acidiferrobacter sp.]|uniref:histidinol-phosphate transaminase n=1 Tax=Acidiferrobacter sp. TaxID=1872107 RepID=UPI00345BE643